MARPVLQGRKVVIQAGTTSNINLGIAGGWEAGAGGVSYVPVEDDVIYVCMGVGNTSDYNPDVGSGTGWSELANLYANGTSYDANLSLNRKVMGSTPDTSVLITGGTGSNAAAGVFLVDVWSGLDTTTPEDVTTTTATGTGTGRPDPPSITPTTTDADVVVMGVGAAGTGAAFTQSGSELTDFLSENQADSVDIAGGIGHFEWTSGAFDPVGWTGGSTNALNSWAAVSIALRPSTAPAATPFSRGFIF